MSWTHQHIRLQRFFAAPYVLLIETSFGWTRFLLLNGSLEMYKCFMLHYRFFWWVFWFEGGCEAPKTWIVKKRERKKKQTFKDLPMILGQCYFSIFYILLSFYYYYVIYRHFLLAFIFIFSFYLNTNNNNNNNLTLVLVLFIWFWHFCI